MGTQLPTHLLGAGGVVQVVHAQEGQVVGGNYASTTPYAGVPNSSCGNQILSLNITPKSSTNKLLFLASADLGLTIAGYLSLFICQPAVASNCLASVYHYMPSVYQMLNLHLRHYQTAGSTSTLTFTLRMGGDAGGGGVFCNANAASGLAGGGSIGTGMTIMEIAA